MSSTPHTVGLPAAAPALWLTAAALTLASCASAPRNATWVMEDLQRRTGFRPSSPGDAPLAAPPDDLDEDMAVAMALRSSPAFQADMARMRAALADFDESARVENPRLTLLGPVGAITAAASLLAPLMSLFRLPQRTRVAARAVEVVAESLVQSGLDLVRDVRVAHVNCVLAAARLENLRVQLAQAEELAGLFDLRADLGDVGPADALAMRSQADLARDAVAVAETENAVARAALASVVGIDGDGWTATSTRPAPAATPPLADLLSIARSARPDVRAAELELEGAALRAGLERSQFLALALQVDVQWRNGAVGARVGGAVALPIFNQNQGGRGRAEAAVVAAHYRVEAVRLRVTSETTVARAQLDQALASHARFRDEIVPALREVEAVALRQYERGDASYLGVLDALTRRTAAELRQVELDAQARRAFAELERAIGARIEVAYPSEVAP